MPTTKKPAPQLLASAGTIEDIEKLINRYWFSESYTVNRSTLAIERPEKPTPAGFRVIHKRGRYRFELLADESASV
jgi:hypothetical protein